MDLKNISKAELTEIRALNLIIKSGIFAELNNKFNKSAIDLKIKNKLVDVQYSGNYKKYGDVRIDLFSYFNWKKIEVDTRKAKFGDKWLQSIKNDILEDIKNLKSKKILKIFDKYIEKKKKYGKYIENKDNMSGVLYFIYDDQIEENIEKFKNQKISRIVYVPTKIILYELSLNNPDFINNWNNKNFQINDKKTNKLKDNYESAFIALNLKNLIKKYPNEIKEYKNKKDFIENFKKDFNKKMIQKKEKSSYKYLKNKF